jgi:deoxyribodipyrimidine photo-lyase
LSDPSTPVIWWARRDLRLHDNPALRAALESGAALIPLFILDPALLRSPAPQRQAFLFAGLRALDSDLAQRGSRLVLRQGDPLVELARICAETGARAIFAGEDYTPYARRRDAAVSTALPLHLSGGVTVHPPQAVHKADGSPYTVFTPYSNAWKALPLLPSAAPAAIPDHLPPCPPIVSLPIPDAPSLAVFPAGEAEALRRLDAFFSGPIQDYAQDRDRMDLEGTSALSPY